MEEAEESVRNGSSRGLLHQGSGEQSLAPPICNPRFHYPMRLYSSGQAGDACSATVLAKNSTVAWHKKTVPVQLVTAALFAPQEALTATRKQRQPHLELQTCRSRSGLWFLSKQLASRDYTIVFCHSGLWLSALHIKNLLLRFHNVDAPSYPRYCCQMMPYKSTLHGSTSAAAAKTGTSLPMQRRVSHCGQTFSDTFHSILSKSKRLFLTSAPPVFHALCLSQLFLSVSFNALYSSSVLLCERKKSWRDKNTADVV